jgi:RNA-directed DNA polymerase
MLVIERNNGRELTHWSQVNWTGVEANVRRLQGRIYRAAAAGNHAQVTNLQRLLVGTTVAKLKAIRQVKHCNAERINNGYQPFKLLQAVQSKHEYKIKIEPLT